MKRTYLALIAIGVVFTAGVVLRPLFKLEAASIKTEPATDLGHSQVKIELTGPGWRYLGRRADWKITVTNLGDSALKNLVVRDQLPPELTFVSTDQRGSWRHGEVVWNLGTLQPGEQKIVQVETNCGKMTPKALNVVVATAKSGLRIQTESAIVINGLPAFRMEVQDSQDPIMVGGKTQYRIDVLNQGTLAGKQLQVTVTIPKQLKVTNAIGPTQPRIDGREIIFPAVGSLPPGHRLTYTVDAQALKPGDARFRVEFTNANFREPVIEEESTLVTASPPKRRPKPRRPLLQDSSEPDKRLTRADVRDAKQIVVTVGDSSPISRSSNSLRCVFQKDGRCYGESTHYQEGAILPSERSSTSTLEFPPETFREVQKVLLESKFLSLKPGEQGYIFEGARGVAVECNRHSLDVWWGNSGCKECQPLCEFIDKLPAQAYRAK